MDYGHQLSKCLTSVRQLYTLSLQGESMYNLNVNANSEALNGPSLL